MAGRTELELTFGKGKQPGRRKTDADGDVSFRLVILGDFGGGGSRGGPTDDARPIPVDMDNVDSVLAGVAPAFELTEGGPTVAFATFDDFHPDRVFARHPAFTALRELRRRLTDPATARETAASLRAAAAAQGPAPRAETGSAESDNATVARLLGKAPAAAAGGGGAAGRAAGATAVVESLLKEAVAAHVVPAADPDQKRLITALDGAIGQHMRALLRDPAYQALEAAWRGVHWLVSGLELDETLRVALVDVSQEHAAADVAAASAAGDPRRSRLYRLLSGGGEPDPEVWTALVGLYSFGVEDVPALEGFAGLGEALGSPFLAAASPALVGCPSFATAPASTDWKLPEGENAARWQRLRQSPAARFLGLALPRFLLRLPYGAKTDPIDSFPFEEQGTPPDHEAYLWGNPALACARLLGELFRAEGTAMEPGSALEIGDLPLHSYADAGESRLLAPSEAFLGERAVDAILQRGIMPFISNRRESTVRLARFQSVASPAAPLAGPWEG